MSWRWSWTCRLFSKERRPSTYSWLRARRFPWRCSRFWVSTPPPVLRRTAQTPRPARPNASSASPRQERLLHLTQRALPPILKSALLLWTVSHQEMYGQTLYMNKTKEIYELYMIQWEGMKTVVIICQRQGALLRLVFLLKYPWMLQLKMFKHYSSLLAVLLFFVYVVLLPFHDSLSFVYMSCVFAAEYCPPFYSPSSSFTFSQVI